MQHTRSLCIGNSSTTARRAVGFFLAIGTWVAGCGTPAPRTSTDAATDIPSDFALDVGPVGTDTASPLLDGSLANDAGEAPEDATDASSLDVPADITVPDAAMDVSTVDLGMDTAVVATDMATTVDLGSVIDSGTDAGMPEDAGPPGIAEITPPWQAGSCSLWEAVPPVCLYQSLASDASGLYAVCDDDFVMHYAGSGWARAQLGGTLRSVVVGTGWTAAIGYDSAPWIYINRGAGWLSVPPPTPSIQVEAATAVGANLVVASTGGAIYQYDGSGWTSLGSLPSAVPPISPSQIWGSPTALYVAYADGVAIYNGAAWSNLTTPAAPSFQGVAGAGGEIFAISGSGLYQVTGTTLVTQPTPGTCSTIRYENLSSSAAGLILAGWCGSTPTVWRRASGAWTALSGTLAFTPDFTVRLSDAGDIYAAGDGASALFYQYISGAWAPLSAIPAPTGGSTVTGRSVTDLWTGGPTGVSSLGTDNLWHADPGASGYNILQLWEAPDGTLFAATSGITLRHRTAAGWHTDTTVASSTVTNITGRSSSDVYVGVGTSLLHWNGTTWSPVSRQPSCAPGGDGLVFVGVTATHVVVDCPNSGFHTLSQYDGTTWTSAPSGFGIQAGTAAMPAVDAIFNTMVQVGTDAGWTLSVLSPIPTSVVTASDPLTLVGMQSSVTFPTTGVLGRARPSGETVISSWITNRLFPVAYQSWTDGRYGVVVGQGTGTGGSGARILRCDFGSP